MIQRKDLQSDCCMHPYINTRFRWHLRWPLRSPPPAQRNKHLATLIRETQETSMPPRRCHTYTHYSLPCSYVNPRVYPCAHSCPCACLYPRAYPFPIFVSSHVLVPVLLLVFIPMLVHFPYSSLVMYSSPSSCISLSMCLFPSSDHPRFCPPPI